MPAKRKAAPLGRNGTAHDRGETGTYSQMPEKASELTARRPKDWTSRRLAWIDAVAMDHRVSAEAFRLAHILGAKFMNPKTGDAWPSQETLAELLGIKERQVRKHLDALCAAGWIGKRRGGKGKPNRYTMTGTQSADLQFSLTGTFGSLDRHSEGRLTGTPSAGESRLEPRLEPEAGLQPAVRSRSTAKGSRSAPGGASLPLVDYFCGQIVTHHTGECEVVRVERSRLTIRNLEFGDEYLVARGPTGEMTDAPF